MLKMSKAELVSLMAQRAPWSVSIFIPGHRTGRESRVDPIRLKKLLGEARQWMVEGGLRDSEALERLKPLRELLSDSELWYPPSRGIAIFLGAGKPHVHRVPIEVEELVVVGDRFHVTPCVPTVNGDVLFFLLALGQKSVRLFEAGRDDIREWPLEGVPSDFAEATKFVQVEYYGNLHTGGPRRQARKQSAVFHGSGKGNEDESKKKRVGEYCQMIDRGVCRALGDSKAPLVVAAAEPLLSLYRQASTYRHLCEEVLRGNPEQLDAATLHEQAVAALSGLFHAERRRAADKYRTLAGTDHAARDLAPILAAASGAEIDTLFAAVDRHCWGRFDAKTLEAEVHETRQPGDEDLIDRAVVSTLTTKGTVHVLAFADMPEPRGAVATLRARVPV